MLYENVVDHTGVVLCGPDNWIIHKEGDKQTKSYCSEH